MLALIGPLALPALLAPERRVRREGGSFSEWFEQNMIDAEDGKIDVSEYLASARGFFPVPIIITEPAVGYGIGAAVAYFHPPKDIDRERHPHRGPPSISVGFAAATENDTKLAGGAHFGIWKDDHLRYLGAVAGADVNLKFYPNIGPPNASDEGIRFNVERGIPLSATAIPVKGVELVARWQLPLHQCKEQVRRG